MKTARRKNICRYGLLAIVFVCLSLFSAFFIKEPKQAAAADSTYEELYVGDVIDAEDYTISYDGGSVQAEKLTVVRPSGGVYGGSSFVAEQAGWYEVTYYATVNGEKVEKQCRYLAIRQPEDLIIADEGTTVSYGKYEVESPYEMTQNTYGAIVAFKAGQSITFNAKIKTSKLTANYNILDFIVMPSVFKETDFEKLTIRVSDAEDASNYVEIIVLSSNTVDGEGQISYIKAGAVGQQAGGYEGSTYHNTGIYGTQVEHSFRALGHLGDFRDTYTISEQSLTVAIDHEEKKVLCGPVSNTLKDKLVVNDLDDPARFKGNPWGGFTSDEVVVQVTAGSFSKSLGTVLFKSFGDYNLARDIEDKRAPEISLQYDRSKKMPVAIVGSRFPMIPYTAKDNLDAQINTQTYVYYVDENGQRINVGHDDESFFVKYQGTYEIVYTATDYSGNKAEEVVTIEAVNGTPDIFIAIDEESVTAEAYQTISIPEAAAIGVFGGSGALTVERTVFSPDRAILDVKDSLQLTELGEYKVVYKVTDYLNNVKYGVITVESVATEAPRFIQTPMFDKKLIKGFTYELAQPFVVETVEGALVDLACETYVNGTLVNGSFTASGDVAEIKYVATGATGISEWSVNVPVVDTEAGKYQSKYFYVENNVTVVDEKEYVAFSFAEDSAIEFVKELYSKGFSLTMSYDVEKMNFSKMSIILTDAQDKTLSVTAAFTYDAMANAWYLQMNGKGSKIAFVTSKNTMTFSRSEDGLKILDSSGTDVTQVKEYDNGEAFKGFSNTVYVRIEFADVQGDSAWHINQICNQTLGYRKSSIDKAKDEIKPVILLDGDFMIRQKLGTVANIPTATACDVLGQITEFTIRVEKADGTVLVNGDATQRVSLTLSEAGSYMVTYFAKDSNGNSVTLPYVMIVNDETAPTITVQNTLKQTYKVGDHVTIPTYSATDNGDHCYIQVELILPNNEVRLLHYNVDGEITSLLTSDNTLYNKSFKVDENTFVLEEKGLYVLRFFAYDEYYNYVAKEIRFNVE